MTNPAASIAPNITMTFSEENGGTLALNSLEDANAWVQEEIRFWNWLLQSWAHNPDTVARESVKGFHSSINQLRDVSVNLTSNNPELVTSGLTRLRHLLTMIMDGGFPHSKSRKALAVQQVQQLLGPFAGIAALAHACYRNVSPQLSASFAGVVKYLLLSEGITTDSVKIQIEAFEGSRARAETKAHEFEQRAGQLISEIETQRTTVTEGVATIIREGNAAIQKIHNWEQDRWATFSAERKQENDAAISDLNKVKDTYSEHMKLKAPVKYWTDKATEHIAESLQYRKYIAWYVPIALVVVVGSIFLLGWKSGSYIDQHVLLVFDAAIILILTTTALWGARILVRLFLSEHHLALDATERAVMAETYLALVNGGAADKSDREALLKAMFRPTADGIVKDDGMPILTPAGFFTKP